MPDTSLALPLLKDMVHEESTEGQVANFMRIARGGLNIMAVCQTEDVCLYKIDPKTGKLTILLQKKADFHDEPSLNQCLLSKGVLVSGGDDCKLRVMALKDQTYTEISQTVELEGPSMPITGVDLNSNNTKVCCSSKDGNAYVYDLKSKNLVGKVSFKYKPEMKNMIMRGCAFRLQDDSLYTLCTQPREPTFLIRWQQQGNAFV